MASTPALPNYLKICGRKDVCEKIVKDTIFYLLTADIDWRDYGVYKWTGQATDFDSYLQEIVDRLTEKLSEPGFQQSIRDIQSDNDEAAILSRTKVNYFMTELIQPLGTIHPDCSNDIIDKICSQLLAAID